LARACAGGIDDDVHTFRLQIKVNNLAQNDLLTLKFDRNRGRDYGDGRARQTAKLRTLGGQWREVLQARANGDQVLEVEVLSSDIVCKMRLVASTGDKEIGSVWCDFGAAESLRRFTNQFDDKEEADIGWLFQGNLYPAGNVSTAKIYRKFKIDPTRGDVNGNWKVVNGHRMRIGLEVQMSHIDPQSETFTKPQDVANFASIVGFDDAKTRTKIVTTLKDGSAQMAIKIGKKVAPVVFTTSADLSQWKDNEANVAKEGSLPIYKLPDLTAEGERVTWFPPPSDIRATVIYRDNGKYPDWTYKAHRLDGSSTRSSESDQVVFEMTELNKFTTDKNRLSFYNINLSPDGKKALFATNCSGFDIDGCHNLFLGNLTTGAYRNIENELFGGGEFWSPDSRSFARVQGTLDTVFGDRFRPDDVLTVMIHDVETRNVWPVLANDSLNRNDLSWSPSGALYFTTFSKEASGNTLFAPTLHQLSNRVELKNLGIGRGARVSPNGQWVAFYGMEDVSRPYGITQMALCVMRADGSERRAINRRPDGTQPDIVWTPDSENLVEIDDGTVREWNLHTGRFREVATLKLTPRPRTNPDESYRNRLTAASVSKSGRYLFITNRQLVNDPKNRGYSVNINVWFALDLQNGALHELALFRNGDFDWHEE